MDSQGSVNQHDTNATKGATAGQISIHPDPDERIGDSDMEVEDGPRLPPTYHEAITMLRDRLGPTICPPLPEPKAQGGASALDFFKDSDVTSSSSALPQCRRVQTCLDDLSLRIQGDGAVQGKTLPFLPKALGAGKFPTLNKPKVFQPHSYDVQEPTLTVEQPPIDPPSGRF